MRSSTREDDLGTLVVLYLADAFALAFVVAMLLLLPSVVFWLLTVPPLIAGFALGWFLPRPQILQLVPGAAFPSMWFGFMFLFSLILLALAFFMLGFGLCGVAISMTVQRARAAKRESA